MKKSDLPSKICVVCKRPFTGINPMKWNEIIGKKAVKDFEKDELIVY